MLFFKDDNKVRVSQTSITTFIGADTKVEGTLIVHSSVRIDGTVVGGVCADGTVVLSQNGQIQGNVIAENIVVAGESVTIQIPAGRSLYPNSIFVIVPHIRALYISCDCPEVLILFCRSWPISYSL